MKGRNKSDDPGGIIKQVLLRKRLTCRNIPLTAAETYLIHYGMGEETLKLLEGKLM